MKKFSKIFEGSSERKLAFWEEDLLNLSDIFLELQEKNICRLDFQAGYNARMAPSRPAPGPELVADQFLINVI